MVDWCSEFRAHDAARGFSCIFNNDFGCSRADLENVVSPKSVQGKRPNLKGKAMRRSLSIVSALALAICFVGESTALGQKDVRRQDARSTLSFRLASATPVAGFQAATLEDGRTVYVAPGAVLGRSDVTSIESIEARRGNDLQLSLTSAASDRLTNLQSRHGADQLAVFQAGRLITSGELELDGETNSALISGITLVDATQITRLIRSGTPSGTLVTLVATSSTIQPGGMITVEAFLSGAKNIRAYQMNLVSAGGTSGKVTLSNLLVETERENYIFRGRQQFEAVDQGGRRLGGVLVNGSVDALDRAYLGSFTVQASADASGTFQVGVKTRQGTSMLMDPDNELLSFSVAPTTVTVMAASSLLPVRK